MPRTYLFAPELCDLSRACLWPNWQIGNVNRIFFQDRIWSLTTDPLKNNFFQKFQRISSASPNVDFLLKITPPSSINLTVSANISNFLKLDERRSLAHFSHPKLIKLNNSLGLYNFLCHQDQCFDIPYYQPIPMTIKIMLFKRPGQRTILFTSVLLSTVVQEALDNDICCSDNGCMFVTLPPTLDSLGEMSGVV